MAKAASTTQSGFAIHNQGRAGEIETRFQAHYPQVQYHFVQFLSEHLVDCLRTFGGDFDQVVILAVLGQNYLDSYFAVTAPLGGRPRSPMNATRIADVTGLPRETVRRKLGLLRDRGWIRQSATREWELIGHLDDTAARAGLKGLDQRGIARLAKLHSALEKLA